MKIEKMSDQQIRCTLTKADLADRELKISELAYGTEKAKNLFRDMMQQASFEFGFEAEDIPLMIEAIPLNADCIILIITKVQDPEELDTRFSKFAPSVHEDHEDLEADETEKNISGADGVLDLFKRINAEKESIPSTMNDKKGFTEKEISVQSHNIKNKDSVPVSIPIDLTTMFSFKSISAVANAAHALGTYYKGNNSLYKNTVSDTYSLVVSKSSHTPVEFNKICNTLSEYATPEKYSPAVESYLQEHYEALIIGNALQALSK